MTRARSIAGAGFIAAVLLGAFAGAEAQAPPSEQTSHVRFETARRLPWGASTKPGTQSTFTFFEREVATPAAVESVDIVLTLSLDFATSRGDYGEIGSSYRVTDDPDAGSRPLRPPRLTSVTSPLPQQLTTTTLVWIAKNVEAAGRTYEFSITAAARDGNNDARAQVFGKHFSVVIDMLPAGDA